MACWTIFFAVSVYCVVVNSLDIEDAHLSTPQLIQKYGYPVEVHNVQTTDGYVLQMHRIPYGKKPAAGQNKSVVFLQHGILCSSSDWIIAGPTRGLAYLMADRGYDVWMGNARGNTYSNNHTYVAFQSKDFWDFSFHEIGVYDLPAMIDYALTVSGQKNLFYVGHSQGTTAFYVMCSERPEYNKKIRLMFSLSPIAFLSHMKNPFLRLAAKFYKSIEELLIKMNSYDLFSRHQSLPTIIRNYCQLGVFETIFCGNVLGLICGLNEAQMNKELLPVFLGHIPAGSAPKQFFHFAQIANKGGFKQYDYGRDGNMVKYGSTSPPDYDLGKVTAPVVLQYSQNDLLSSEIDVFELYSRLKNPVGMILAPEFGHLDYIWGKDVVNLCYNVIFKMVPLY